MNFDLSKKRYWLLLAILTVISYGVAYCIVALINASSLKDSVKIFIEAPGFFGVFFMLTFLFDRYFWKWRIWRIFGIINFPNLTGTYRGTFSSSYKDSSGVNVTGDIELKISQTSTSIKVQSSFNESRSISTVSFFAFNDIRQTICLYYFYRNTPKPHAAPAMHQHEGSVILSYDENTRKIEGEYFSGRDRNNFGIINATKL